MPGNRLTDEQVAAFARLAIQGIPREFPNKPSNVMTGIESVLRPRQMHPVFYGSFDWHSSVHGHWMLVRLAKTSPDVPVIEEVRELLHQQFRASDLAAEAAYFEKPSNKSFERMYGWAWVLRLATELRTWDDADARGWAANLKPLEQQIVSLTKDYLPRLTYPIRTGVHPDTAFALGQTLDYARTVGDTDLEAMVVGYCREKYLADLDYPLRYEPSGEDFFSAGWNEADLMRRVLPAEKFAEWLTDFLPRLPDEKSLAANALVPAVVSDVTDPKLVHLAGLNLSRAWAQNGVLAALPDGDPRRPLLKRSVAAQARAGLDYVFSGHYEGEHWLATFAVYLLTQVGAPH
ncbi:DUF2891 domain-containing protein [Botrimarina hoheduenensis]|uniref:DUF2891 domain-containing protein n=1 Tax=Botrimarina hoheduenensis TaxID=2528000 RepID=A0A5C5VQZ7_9BACT|nr:DUF2891 domain-containing protein [Botrimarina hoheduenensis]TWT40089.1 hypothetical protein Pla111_34620 [Botrimarina hoheduenensis]